MKYTLKTLQHKWFVLIAGLKIGAPFWRLIIHDWTKFLPSELPHYQRQFYGEVDDPDGWVRCWVHHQNSNPHHWEYWYNRSGRKAFEPIEMPIGAVLEMVADWMAASRAYDGIWPEQGKWEWFEKNFDRIKLHVNSRQLVLTVLRNAGLAGEE